MSLGQGHGKFIQYISTDLYIRCPKYLRFSSNGLTWEAKVVEVAADVAAADTAAAAAETNWKHKVTPDRGDLITNLTYSYAYKTTHTFEFMTLLNVYDYTWTWVSGIIIWLKLHVITTVHKLI